MDPIKDYKTTQNELAEKLTKKKKEFYQCSTCSTVYPGCCGLVICGWCGKTKDGYINKNGTVTKTKK